MLISYSGFMLMIILYFLLKKMKNVWMLFLNFKYLNLKFSLQVLMDFFSLNFLLVLILMVSTILKFTLVYLDNELYLDRFFFILLAFMFSMIILILFPSWLFLLIGWDGLGVTSFFLMCFYLKNISWSASMKTYLMKRLGDGFLMFGMFLLTNKNFLFLTNKNLFNTFFILIIFGFFTKSAQFPFSSWLPAAMAAPTPVSALVHSSTLVTAGIYLYFRFFWYFPDFMKQKIFYLGFLTLIFSSMTAFTNWDSKKMVAFSTLSQLGLMVIMMTLKNPFMAFFHLLIHALFKSLLFIKSGIKMLYSDHKQDLRYMNWGKKKKKIMLFYSLFCLSGLFFMGGFFSKDLMMEMYKMKYKFIYFTLFVVILFCTLTYSFRLIWSQIFYSWNIHNLKVFMKKYLYLLFFMSIFYGWIFFKDFFLFCWNTPYFKNLFWLQFGIFLFLLLIIYFMFNSLFVKTLFFLNQMKGEMHFFMNTISYSFFQLMDEGNFKILLKMPFYYTKMLTNKIFMIMFMSLFFFI